MTKRSLDAISKKQQTALSHLFQIAEWSKDPEIWVPWTTKQVNKIRKKGKFKEFCNVLVSIAHKPYFFGFVPYEFLDYRTSEFRRNMNNRRFVRFSNRHSPSLLDEAVVGAEDDPDPWPQAWCRCCSKGEEVEWVKKMREMDTISRAESGWFPGEPKKDAKKKKRKIINE
jgi:hypothetical protein